MQMIFLISQLRCKPFLNFTLWSQHLVLHSRDSLHKPLNAAGFVDIRAAGVQRCGLANHLSHGSERVKPKGTKSPLSFFETTELARVYESAPASQDCTDTPPLLRRLAQIVERRILIAPITMSKRPP
jgi:hypothetical protein